MDQEPIFGVDPTRLSRLLSLGTEVDVSEQQGKEAHPADERSRHPGPTVSVDALFEWSGGRVGPYTLREVLGEGGMGVVYLAEQESPIKRRVALKVIKPGMDSRQVVARFEAERQALALLDHPNIAQVHDAGTTEGGRPYFVMELVEGVTITEYCDRHKLTIEKRLRLFQQVCLAVHHAHQKGIIHRDIKPSNILVSAENDRPTPKIIDFGVAKALTQSLTEWTLYTEQGQFVGTPEYMSPEQAEMTTQDIDTRSDVYSLGAVLYELLTGILPFDSDTLRKGGIEHIRRVIREEEPKTPSTRLSSLGERAARVAQQRRTEVGTLARRLRKEMEWIPLKAMRKERERRYRSASELADDIENYLQGTPLIAGPESTVYRVQKLVRRNRALVGGGITLLSVLTAGVVISTLLAVGQTRARGEAQAVSDFLRHNLIESLDPYRVGGREITIRSVLDSASEALEGQLAGKPLAEGQIRQSLGFAYWSHGEYDLAEGHFRRGLELYRAHAGANHGTTLELMMNVGWLCYYQGRYDEAAQFFRPAVRGMRRVLGPEHATTLHTANSLACIYFIQGHLREARQLADQAIEATLRCLDAEQIVEEIALVAWGYHVSGQYEQAEQLFTRGLEICRLSRGKNDYYTVKLKYAYGELCTTLGRYDEAEQLLLAALDGQRQAWAQHPETLETTASVAVLYLAQGRYERAEALLDDALETARREFGDAHMCTLECMAALGASYLSQERYDEAEPLLVRALEIGTRLFGEEHWGILSIRNILAELYTAQGRHAEAEQEYLKALTSARLLFGNRHGQTLTLINGLGALYVAQHRYDEAQPLLTEALETGRRVFGEEHPTTLRSKHELAMLHMQQARYEDAEPLLLDAFRGREAKLGPEHPHTIESLRELVRLYESWPKPDEAAKWRAKRPDGDITEE